MRSPLLARPLDGQLGWNSLERLIIVPSFIAAALVNNKISTSTSCPLDTAFRGRGASERVSRFTVSTFTSLDVSVATGIGADNLSPEPGSPPPDKFSRCGAAAKKRCSNVMGSSRERSVRNTLFTACLRSPSEQPGGAIQSLELRFDRQSIQRIQSDGSAVLNPARRAR